MKIMRLAAVCLLLLSLTACVTDYSENAVERARTFALQNLRGLTESQRHFIEYTQPDIYENLIFPRYVVPLSNLGHLKLNDSRNYPTNKMQDFMHSCVVWTPPDLGAKVVVIGDGERSMRLWRPTRVLVKNYVPVNSGFLSAVDAARNYIGNNLLFLSDEDKNRIRFADPQVVYTRLSVFEPNESQQKQTKELSPWESYLADKKNGGKKNRYVQISLVWPLHQEGRVAVATGYSTSGTLSGWQLRTGEEMAVTKLHGATLSPEEVSAIPKEASPEKILFPVEEKIDRNPYDDTPDANQIGGGSILYNVPTD